MTYKSILLLLASSITAVASATVFRLALKGTFHWKGSAGVLFLDTLRLLANPGFLLGIAIFVLANLLWLLVLGSQKLSVAYPVQIGLVLILSSLISAVVFREFLSFQGYVGVLLVILGVILIVR
jgi:multidrug transporter EmrE-like cation transporter